MYTSKKFSHGSIKKRKMLTAIIYDSKLNTHTPENNTTGVDIGQMHTMQYDWVL